MASTITATPTTTLATAATSAAAAKLQPLLLTTLPVSSSSNIHGALIINQTYIGGSCAVRDQLFTSCIAEHAPSGGVYGTATYLLDGLGAIRFQASVGNSNTNCDSVRGQVRLDGVTVDQQDIRSCMFYDVDIPVPPGTTTLTLATNQLGSTNTRDHLLWGDPRLIVTVTPIVTTTATSTTTLNATHSTTTTAATATTCTAEEGTQLSPIVAFSVAEGAVFSRNEDDGAHGNCLDADGAVKDEFKDGRTTWSKLRVDLTTLRINATDQTYATRVTGNRNLQLGYASNCGGSYSTLGEAMVDLRGTPFAITNVSADGNCDCPDSTGCTCSQWTAIGFNSAMKLVCTNNNQRCTVSCGGSSGSCSLAAGYLQLEYLAGYGIADVRRQCGILKPVPGQWILGGSNQNCVEVCAAQSWFSRCDLNVLTTFGAGSVPNPSWTDMCLDYGDGSSRLHPSLRVSDSKCYTNGEDDDARETCEHKDPNFRRFCPCSTQLQPPPLNTGMSLVVEVAGTTLANDDFWAVECLKVPPNTVFIVVDMGSVRDFFKPINASTTYCEMLQTYDKHQWSANGVDWFEIEFFSDHNGGSAFDWPRDNGTTGDKRSRLSIWGTDHQKNTGGCCSTSTAEHMTHTSLPGNSATYFGQSFALSYATQLQPLPLNTGMSLVVEVAGTTLANDDFWAVECLKVPPNTVFIVVDMGSVRDFFKPINASTTYCEMLQTYDKHQWSANGVDWFEIEFFSDHNGGSAFDWPRDNGTTGDKRSRLSIWGTDHQKNTGGCCSTSTAEHMTHTSLPGNSATYFGQSFALSYATQLQPLPLNTGMSLVVEVAGTTLANDDFWAVECLKVPPNTVFIVLDMGAVRDFFRPTTGETFCTMLKSNDKHQWSRNGVDWYTSGKIKFHSGDGNGGSAAYWPQDSVQGDSRQRLSFWGNDGVLTGGCCSTSTAVGTTGSAKWGQSFTVFYAIRLQPQHWRVSNAGATTWKPGVNLAFFSDVACTASIAIPADGGWPDAASTCPSTGCALCSGWDAVFGTVATKGCHLALSGGSWRPGRVSSGTESYFPVGEVWMEIRFASDPGIACVKASGMGKGSGDGNRWNGGLTVQTSVDGVTYVTRERDEGAASTYNLDANYFPVLPPPPKLLISTSTVASTTTTEGGARSTKGRATSVGVNSNASEAAAEVSPKSDDEVTSTRKPSSTGTIVGVVVSLAVVAAVVGGLFMMRKKEQSRQRALTRGGGANRQQRQGRNEQVYTNAAFDGGNESGNDSEDYLEPVSTGAGNREYEPPPGLPAPAGSGYYSEIGTLRNSDTYAKPNEGAAEYAANGSGSGVVYATYAGSQGAEEAHYDMAQDEYAALEGGKSVYSSSA